MITFFVLPPSKQILFERLSNRDMKDKLIAEERMKEFSRDVLHWINYDYVVINDNIDECYSKINNLIDAEINNGSKDYDKEYIRKHVEVFNLLNLHILWQAYNIIQVLNFVVLNLNQY